MAFALPLVWEGGWPIVIIGVISLAMGYCYTGGPFPLAYLGLGDLFNLGTLIAQPPLTLLVPGAGQSEIVPLAPVNGLPPITIKINSQ